jgi:hypothetical protein
MTLHNRDRLNLQSKQEDTTMNIVKKVVLGNTFVLLARRSFRMLPPTARKIITVGSISVSMAVAFAVTSAVASGIKVVDMNDQCDPATFNAAVGDGTCVSSHAGVTFDHFLRELGQTQKVGAWNFVPGEIRLQDGQAFQARNRGGEVHTFTEVDEFGGGFIPFLNDLSGTPVPAPECLDLGSLEFIPAGGTGTPETEEPGVHHYQCCIHPWMRADVTVR